MEKTLEIGSCAEHMEEYGIEVPIPVTPREVNVNSRTGEDHGDEHQYVDKADDNDQDENRDGDQNYPLPLPHMDQLNSEVIEKLKQRRDFFFTTDCHEDYVVGVQDGQETCLKSLFNLIAQMKELRILSLAHLDLHQLTNNIACYPETVRILYLTGNCLDDLPEAFAVFQNLEKLQLGNNRFTVVPEVIGRLRALKYLELSRNDITSAGLESLKTVRGLEQLYLNGNMIKDSIEAIIGLETLRVLDLSFNKIGSIPEDFRKLKNLRYLRMKCNRLRTLPATILELNNIEILCFSENTLTKVPDAGDFKEKLPKLRLLCMHSNRLEKNTVESFMKIFGSHRSAVDARFAENRIDETVEDWGSAKWRRIMAGCTDVFEEDSYRHDVFILHSEGSKDEDLITDQVLGELKKRKLSVAVDFKDFRAGKLIKKQFSEFITRSRKVLLFITSNYSNTPMEEYCLEEALNRQGKVQSRSVKYPKQGRHDPQNEPAVVIPVLWEAEAEEAIPTSLKNLMVIRRRHVQPESRELELFWDRICKEIKD